MIPAEALAFVALIGLVVYAVLGGADFGGGVLDLLARGKHADRRREVISAAIAPVWEANHVWLIAVIVILFAGFPRSYAVIMTALHIPVTLMLLGIVFRGSAFTFRQYDVAEDSHRKWGRVFGLSSLITPIFLGVSLGAITAGEIRLVDGVPIDGFFSSWLSVFPFLVGLFTLSLFVFLAAVFLTNETSNEEDQEVFRRQAFVAAVVVGLTALVAGFFAETGVDHFADRLFGSWWSWPHQILTGLCAIGVFTTLWLRKYAAARVLAILQVSLIVLGWGFAQYPYLVAPEVTIEAAAAPDATIRLLLWAFAAGAVILFPSLYYLMRVFKRPSAAIADRRSQIPDEDGP